MTREKFEKDNRYETGNSNFFDYFPRFYDTSRAGATANRLNLRHKALIEQNAHLFPGKRVLDLASHDGRWSFAALKAGADYVLGIEGRQSLVDSAHENMEYYGIARESYDFMMGDVHALLKEMSQPFDIVLCFGFLYHTPFHMQIMMDMARLATSHIIIDTLTFAAETPVVHFIYDNVSLDRDSIDYSNQGNKQVLVGYPSRSFIDIVLAHLNFKVQYANWHTFVQNWKNVEDYRSGERISLLAARKA